MQLQALGCPQCGGPLPAAPASSYVICVYCSASVRLAAPDGAAAPAASLGDVPPDVMARVRQLVLDGQRAEAVELYQQHSGASPAEAQKAVEQLATSMALSLTGAHPLSAVGMVVVLVLMAVCIIGLITGLTGGVNGQPFPLALGVISGLVLVLIIRWFVPKARSTLVQQTGKLARATVRKAAVLKPDMVRGGTLMVLALEVQPGDDQPRFLDQETVMIRNESVPKLQPGNVIQVRYDPRDLDHVFPESPIKVWDETARAFV